MRDLVFDFHMHTTASDGTHSPDELVHIAARTGMVAMAITDHDTIGGLSEGAPAAEALGIEFFNGVELNTDASDIEIDILGYFVEIDDLKFRELVQYREGERIRRAKGMVDKLNAIGLNITYKRVREIAGGVVARPHVAQALIEKGYVANQKEAYDRYIGYGRSAYVERDPLTPEVAIEHIREAGGLPMIAHPGLIGDDDMVLSLLAAGAEGLEAYYAYHSPEQIDKYLQIAQEYKVIVGCGSDYHGPNRSKSRPLGSVHAPLSVLEEFREAVWDRWQHKKAAR